MTDSSSSLSSLEASVITPTSAIQAGVSVTTTKAQITKLSPSLAEDLYKKESLKQEPHLKIIHLVRHAQGKVE